METTKKCGICNTVKSVNDFNKSTRDGFRFECKSCDVECVKRWREANIECYNEQQRTRYANNVQHQINKNMHKKLWSILRRGHFSLRTVYNSIDDENNKNKTGNIIQILNNFRTIIYKNKHDENKVLSIKGSQLLINYMVKYNPKINMSANLWKLINENMPEFLMN